MIRHLIATGLAILACPLSAFAADAAKPADTAGTGHGATLAPMKQPPTLDGTLAPGEWDYAARTTNFLSISNQTMDPRQGTTLFGYCGDRLYVAVVSELPPRPTKGPYSSAKTRDAEVIWDANAIEIWFDPNRDRRESGEGDQAFYQLFINTIGTTEDVRFVPGGSPDKGWNPDVQSGHGLDTENKLWTAEISIPFKDLGLDPQKLTGASLGLLVSRNYKAPWCQVTGFPHHGAFVSWRHYPRIFLTADEPVVAIESLGERFLQAEPDIRVAIRNPGPARTARVKLHIKSSDMPDIKEEKEIALPAGGSAEYRHTVPKDRLHVKDIDHSLTLRVEAADSKRTWFDYAANWSHDPLTTIGWTIARRSVEKKWDIRTDAAPDESLGFAVYPSFNQIRVSLNAAAMVPDPDEQDAAKVSDSAVVTITTAAGKEFAKATLNWDRAKKQAGASHTFELAAIPAGDYAITALFNKQPDKPITKQYTRRNFPFEGNTLGITDTIYPPFAPVKAEGDKVTVVCREYQAGNLGLWRSVKSLGKELLAGPIVLKVSGGRGQVSGEKAGAPAPGGSQQAGATDVLRGAAQLVKVTPMAATYESEAKHAAVTVKSRCTTEIDGCTKVELTLLPPEGKQVSGVSVQDGSNAQTSSPETRNPTPDTTLAALWLEIPLKDELMPLWHVSTTGLRNNPVGEAPRGEGLVWDSRKFPDGNWIGNFKCYLWLGGTDRGLCWFADNDKGWVLNWNDKKVFSPCQELIRKDGVLTLRVNLVQKPVTITEPRRIVFGLMASPGKPMPADWRSAQFAGGLGKGYEQLPTINFMGSQYWGSEEVFCAAYPRNADLSILDAMSRIKGTAGGDLIRSKGGGAFVVDWTERNFKPDMPVKGKSKEQLVHLANVSMNSAAGGRYYTVYWDEYYHDSGLHPETQVYAGEWRGNGLVRSRQDFRAYWAAEFVKRNIGLYFDNAFPRSTRDTLTSDAYEIPGLGVQPAATLWAQRDYHRRIFNIHRQFGAAWNNRPLQMIHMTNTNIVPYLTWSDATLDLEWFYGPEPQQSKYSHAMLRAQSAGQQTGCYPCVLARIEDVKTPEQGRLANRSRFGTMAVHEIKAQGPEGQYRHLYDIGYGTPACTVYNYWNENHPVQASHPDLKTLLLKNGNDLLLLVCSWLKDPTVCTFTFDTKSLGVSPVAATDAEDQVGAAKAAVAAAEKAVADATKAVADRQKDLEAKKLEAEKKLASAQAAEKAARAKVAVQQAMLAFVEGAVKPVTYEAVAARLTVPLEGYGVRIIRLK